MASPETREVVRSALRKVPCFINLDDEKKFSYVCHRLRTVALGAGRDRDLRGRAGLDGLHPAGRSDGVLRGRRQGASSCPSFP